MAFRAARAVVGCESGGGKCEYAPFCVGGLRALLYDPKGMAGTHADLSSDDVIRSLDEVPARLDSILAE